MKQLLVFCWGFAFYFILLRNHVGNHDINYFACGFFQGVEIDICVFRISTKSTPEFFRFSLLLEIWRVSSEKLNNSKYHAHMIFKRMSTVIKPWILEPWVVFVVRNWKCMEHECKAVYFIFYSFPYWFHEGN